MVLLCMSAGAQNKILITQDVSTAISGHTWAEKVKNWPGTNYAVSLTGTDSTRGFCLISYNQYTTGSASPVFPLRYVELPPMIASVYDFCVVGNYIFFCADTFVYGDHNKQFIGFFDLNSLSSGAMVSYTLMPIDTAATLYKIAGFNDGYGFKVYAAGTIPMGDDLVYALFEIDNPPSAIAYNCTYFDIGVERTDDIVFLRDAIIVVGRWRYNGLCAISIRKASKTLGLIDPDFINAYIYPNPITSICEYNSAIQAIALNDKEFAIVYSHYDENNEDYVKRIRLYDYTLSNTNSQEYQCDDKYAIYDMTYLSKYKSLAILEPYNEVSRFVYPRPYNTSAYTALTMHESSKPYTSLDNISTSAFISLGGRKWLMADSTLAPVQGNLCVQKDSQKIRHIPNITPSPFPSGLPLSGYFNQSIHLIVPQTNVLSYQ